MSLLLDERHLSQFQCIITSSLLVKWTVPVWLKIHRKMPHEKEPIYCMWVYLTTICRSPEELVVYVCVHFCVNVWCLHLMFVQLINSGDAVLRWHIVQASLSPHPNQINSECHLCTHWPPGQDLELRDAASHKRRARTLSENCKSIGSFVKTTPDFGDKKAFIWPFKCSIHVFCKSNKDAWSTLVSRKAGAWYLAGS